MPGRNRYQAYTLANFRAIPQMERLSEEMKFDIEVVGRVLPFKTNNFVVEQLIDWERVPDDPMFILTFPQRDMLMPQHYEEVARLLRAGADAAAIRAVAWSGQLSQALPMRSLSPSVCMELLMVGQLS